MVHSMHRCLYTQRHHFPALDWGKAYILVIQYHSTKRIKGMSTLTTDFLLVADAIV